MNRTHITINNQGVDLIAMVLLRKSYSTVKIVYGKRLDSGIGVAKTSPKLFMVIGGHMS